MKQIDLFDMVDTALAVVPPANDNGNGGPRYMPVQKPHRSVQSYQTPPAFIAAVEERFGPLTFDLAANDNGDDAQAPRWFGPSANSLTQDWSALAGNLWLNPPFGNIAPWAEKCDYTRKLWRQQRHQKTHVESRIFLLTPASVGSNWFVRHVFEKSRVFFLNGRLSFDGKAPYPKDLVLSCYGDVEVGCECWRWAMAA